MNALTVQGRRFVMAYCGEARGNATLAAQKAGIGGTYSAQANRASVLLRDPAIISAVEAWMESYGLTPAQLTASIADLAQVNPGPFFEISSDGKLQLKEKISPDEWEAHKHWIKAIRTDEKGKVVDIELHNSMEARRELAKIHKLYSDAPLFALQLHLHQIPDTELLKQLAEARAEEDRTIPGARAALPPGGPVAVVG